MSGIRVVHDKDGLSTHVYDAESGKEISGIYKIELMADVSNGWKAILYTRAVAVDVVASNYTIRTDKV
jgi:hypothetical protein